MLITEFYKNKELFITGGTGYLGKSFIEKLLRDCPGVSKVYILIRAKKNISPLERLKEFSNDLVFERLHREQPKAFEKVFPIAGDSSQLGLGICSEDIERLKNVDIIIHGAADVRFDSALGSSILMNTRGTHELLKLAVNLKKLIAFIHISTAYVSPFESYTKEQLCDAPVDWRAAIKIAENVDREVIEILKDKYTRFPNAYSFTKNLSEQVVAEFAEKLPVTILRPSIVSNAIQDPEPGYIGNLNGPMGVLVASGAGIAQVTYSNKNLVMALIPVDAVTNLTIFATYRRGLESINSRKYGLDIRNLTPGDLYNYTCLHAANIYLKQVRQEPYEQTLWAPTVFLTDNFFIFIMSIFLINIPLALAFDAVLTLSKKERMFMKLTRKFVFTSKAVGKFSHDFFDFQNDGMWELIKIVPEKEKEKFGNDFFNKSLDIDNISKNLHRGIKKYILKQPLNSTPVAKLRFKIVVILDQFIKIFVLILIITLLWRLVN